MRDQIDGVFASLPDLFSQRCDLIRKSNRADIVLLLDAGDARARLRISGESVTILPAGGPMAGWDIALRADPAAWADHWAAVPAPDAFDIFGMVRHGRMRIEGNFAPLMRHLQLVKDILALPRAAA